MNSSSKFAKVGADGFVDYLTENRVMSESLPPVADTHTASPAEAPKKPWTTVLMPIRPFGSRRAGS